MIKRSLYENVRRHLDEKEITLVVGPRHLRGDWRRQSEPEDRDQEAMSHGELLVGGIVMQREPRADSREPGVMRYSPA